MDILRAEDTSSESNQSLSCLPEEISRGQKGLLNLERNWKYYRCAVVYVWFVGEDPLLMMIFLLSRPVWISSPVYD